ncbi:putative 5-keto-D-gluconate 5-reductase [Annulohypoxylon maeteangense]|uniref:putative 5-keto-D-gluconate 5-reductase n=1 Tax=Annulohypoxylon maeteangense TaxID=1927788 RepID=UPI002007D25A|nr:putative 5-keto-D-gluconate 5-reductase [Annulohypoxylon maeteangense]KAI0882160.1 putative 5-keto-D-gluconate 5-reductase [Annulohypoxylon maeteangense]
MATLAPRMSRAAPSIGKLARATPRATPACGFAAAKVTGSATCRWPTGDRPAHRSFHSTPMRGSKREPVQGSPSVLPEFDLRGKVIIVSGAAQGLGLVQAEALLEAGATVHVYDRQPEPASGSKYDKVARRAKEELCTSMYYHQVDVLDGAANLQKITGEVFEKEGHIDGLIAAAGIQQETAALDYTAEDSNRMLAVNVTGVLMTAQAVAKYMYENDTPGSIILIASMSGSVANRGLICPVYNASKAAVLQLGRNLAMEWGVKNIRVNTISPGYIVTEMVQKLFEKFPDRSVEWPKQNMLNKLSKPEDYRGAAVFLLSDASRFMTGADLRIDGGHSAW